MSREPALEEIQSWLARVQDVAGGGLGEAQAIDQIRALEEVKSAMAAAQARLTAELHLSRTARERATGVPAHQRGRGLGAEVALARRVSPVQGNRHVGFALALVREMPHLQAALSAGQVSEWRATLVVKETAVLSAAHRTEVDRQIADKLTDSGYGDRRLGDEARRIGYRLDPGSAIRRTRGAHSDRRVSLRPAPDTMTYLTGFLPVAQGVACQAALKRHADSLKAQGDERSRGQIMADTLVARVTGQAEASGTPVEVAVVMTDKALLSTSHEPADLVGFGPIPAAHARDLVREAARAWTRRLYTRPDNGALVAMDSRRRVFQGKLRQFLLLKQQFCSNAWCDAPVRHIDHPTPHSRGGPTSAANAAPLCEACNYTKELPGWHAVVHTRSDGSTILDITSPTGHRHRSRAPDAPGTRDPAMRLVGSVLSAAS